MTMHITATLHVEQVLIVAEIEEAVLEVHNEDFEDDEDKATSITDLSPAEIKAALEQIGEDDFDFFGFNLDADCVEIEITSE